MKQILPLSLLIIFFLLLFMSWKDEQEPRSQISKQNSSQEKKYNLSSKQERRYAKTNRLIQVESHARKTYDDQKDIVEQKTVSLEKRNQWKRISVIADKNGHANTYIEEIYVIDQRGEESMQSKSMALMGQALVVLHNENAYPDFVDQINEKGWSIQKVSSHKTLLLVKFPFDDLETHLSNAKLLKEILGDNGLSEPNHIVNSI